MNTNKHIDDIYTNMQINSNFLNVVKFINIDLINKQQIAINKIVTFIKNNNYFGEDYHNYKDNQNKAMNIGKNILMEINKQMIVL